MSMGIFACGISSVNFCLLAFAAIFMVFDIVMLFIALGILIQKKIYIGT